MIVLMQKSMERKPTIKMPKRPLKGGKKEKGFRKLSIKDRKELEMFFELSQRRKGKITWRDAALFLGGWIAGGVTGSLILTIVDVLIK